MDRRRALLSTLGGLALSGITGLPNAFAASASSRPVRMLVGFPAGGSTDVAARAIAAQARTAGGRNIIVENIAGAAGRLAVDRLVGSEPDGVTVLVAPTATMALFPHIYRSLRYQPETDITPVAPICSLTFSLMLSNEVVPSSVQNLEQLKAWFQQNPEKASYASGGAGTPMHFIGVMLEQALGLPLTHVPYKGAPPMVQDLIGGQVPVGMVVIGDGLPHIKSGKLRPIAVAAAQRSVYLKDVPTFAELGAPEISVQEGFGVYLPAGASPEVVGEWHDMVSKAVDTQPVQELLISSSYEPAHADPGVFAQQIRDASAKWAAVVEKSGFSIEE